jgi:hypothetical protein
MPAVVVTQWPPREVTELRHKLDELAELVRQPYAGQPQEVRDWLARVLVVRSCGYLEQTTLEVCRGYVHGRSGGPVRAFGRSWLERGSNPTPDALIALVGRFDATWAANLHEVLEDDDQRLYREVSFLVDRRNKIAHGLNEGIGTVKALQLSQIACEVSDWFIARFNPER